MGFSRYCNSLNICLQNRLITVGLTVAYNDLNVLMEHYCPTTQMGQYKYYCVPVTNVMTAMTFIIVVLIVEAFIVSC